RYPQRAHILGIEFRIGECVVARDRLQPLSLELMGNALLELMMAADMIDMRMGGHRRDRLVENVFREGAPTANAHAGIDDQTRAPRPHLPVIAAQGRGDMRLQKKGDAISRAAHLDPMIGNLQSHDRSPCLSLSAFRGACACYGPLLVSPACVARRSASSSN